MLPRCTPNGSHDNVQGMHAGNFSKKRRRKDSELDDLAQRHVVSICPAPGDVASTFCVGHAYADAPAAADIEVLRRLPRQHGDLLTADAQRRGAWPAKSTMLNATGKCIMVREAAII